MLRRAMPRSRWWTTAATCALDTNFNWHGYHLNSLGFDGTGGVDIDISGAGQGNATCAECHFRTHGTALAADGQEPEKGLVNFAPNVQPLNGSLSVRARHAHHPGHLHPHLPRQAARPVRLPRSTVGATGHR